MTDNTLLTVRGLSLEVARTGHRVVKDVSFDIAAGEIFGIVGESGSGKTLATRALISLLPPAIAVTGGSIVYKGQDVMSLPVKALRNLRGAEIGVVFHEPMTSLDPSM
ncbi:MAG: ATP-binding cassette domain-containing protein, partial [Rhizobium pusense]|nr:ATP-binding cassette domain-containing protein [Agrobacterium pusense]